MPVSATQKAIIDARGKNILVSASAGSGKTSVLVNRLCDLVIQDKIGIDRILAMTFTEDAAAEMKTRLKKQLQEQDLKDPYIARQLALLETASISTIHGFCLDLLQKYYYLIPIPYSMAQNVETGLKAVQALQQAYSRAVLQLDPARYAALKLYMQANGKTEEDLQKTILDFLEIAKTKPNPEAWMESARQAGNQAVPWFFGWFELRIKALQEIMDEMVSVIPTLNFAKAQKEMEWVTLFENKSQALKTCLQFLKQKDYDAFRQAFLNYLETTGKFAPSINKVRFDELQKDSRQLEKEIGEALFTREEMAQQVQTMEPLQNTLVDLAIACRQEFQEAKREMGIIDFSDMEQFAWQLLQHPAVAAEVKKKYEVILVDEYQDTNDLQESIIYMAARKDNVFRVGDVKQSIYGFRQARPALMRSLMNQNDDLHQHMVMDENFRSTDALIQFNNAFFGQLMNIPGMEPQFHSEDEAHPGLESQKEGPQKPARFLYTKYGGWVAEEGDNPNDTTARKVHKTNRIDIIAKDIQEKIKAGYEYRDIAILTRASTNHNTIKQGLEAYGIPLISKAKKGFYTNQAVQIVMAVLKVLVNPRDDIAMMAMLCSPIGQMTQAQIVQACLKREEQASLYDTLRVQPDMLKLFRLLESWKQLPVGELVEKIYNYNNFYYRHTTAQDKTNLDLFLEKASKAEQDVSLEQFTELILQEEDFNETGEAMPFGKEANVVKITTIHSSKGLQYPIVYVLTEDKNPDLEAGNCITLDPDLGMSLLYLSEDRHIKKKTWTHLAMEHRRFMEDQYEKMRLFYVACTRAEKELAFVDTIKNEKEYAGPLNMRSVWKNKGFTSWIAHIFQNENNPLFVMEEQPVFTRPESPGRKNFYASKPLYSLPVQEISSQIASAAKSTGKWKPVNFNASRGMERGTLFHTMAESLPYPYQREEAIAFARRKNMELTDQDLRQFLSLNDNPLYASWMHKQHRFEAPYNVFMDGALLHGYMDMMVRDGQDIHILDFKTDAVFDMDHLEKNYRPQLEMYKKAVSQIEPDKNVHIWLYSFFLQEIREITEKTE